MTLLDLVSKGLRALGGAEGRAGRAQGAFFFLSGWGGNSIVSPRSAANARSFSPARTERVRCGYETGASDGERGPGGR